MAWEATNPVSVCVVKNINCVALALGGLCERRDLLLKGVEVFDSHTVAAINHKFPIDELSGHAG